MFPEEIRDLEHFKESVVLMNMEKNMKISGANALKDKIGHPHKMNMLEWLRS